MKYDLMFGCYGNGILVSNKAVIEYGDYAKVAHISPAGNITYYDDNLPAFYQKKISSMAERNRVEFKRTFEMYPDIEQYAMILDVLPLRKLLEVSQSEKGYKELLPTIREYYYSIM